MISINQYEILYYYLWGMELFVTNYIDNIVLLIKYNDYWKEYRISIIHEFTMTGNIECIVMQRRGG